MEDTYAKFIQDAQNSVGSDYAKSVLESYRQYDGDTGGLVRSIADIFQNSFLNIDFAADWIGPAVCILLLFLLFHMVQNLLKSRAAVGAVQYFLNMALAVTVAAPVYELMSRACMYMNDVTLFFGVLAPVMGVMTASGGNVAAAGAGSVFLTIFLAAAQFLIDRLARSMRCFYRVGYDERRIGRCQYASVFEVAPQYAVRRFVRMYYAFVYCNRLPKSGGDKYRYAHG